MPGRFSVPARVVALVFFLARTTGLALSPDSLAEYETRVRPFLEQHCLACHDARKAKAGLRLDELGTDFLAGKTADLWHEVINSINAGEMPPEEVEDRPEAAEAFAVVEWVGRELKNAERAARMAGGRILSRRLNRDEYLNTVADLLHLDRNFVQTLRDELPGDGKAEGFDRIGSALLFDATQLETYVRLGDRIAREALVDGPEPPESHTLIVEVEDSWKPKDRPEEVIQYQKDTLIPAGPDDTRKLEDGVLFLQAHNYDKREFGSFTEQLRVAMWKMRVPRDGYYRIRIRAGADPGARGTPLRIRLTYLPETPLQVIDEVTVTGLLDAPAVVEKVMFLRRPPEGSEPRLVLHWNGLRDVVIQHPDLSASSIARNRANSEVQKLITAKAPAAEIETAKAEAARRVEEARALSQRPGMTAKVWNPDHDLETVPKMFLDWVEISGPVSDPWPPASHTALLTEGTEPGEATLRPLLERLLPRAYRRPAKPEEVDFLAAASLAARDRFDLDGLALTRHAVQLVLSSPEFLLLFEPSSPGAPKRPIGGHELASRLSYFLWSTMPDEALFRLAASGELLRPDTLQKQVTRMIAHPKSRQLAENFAGQWLQVRDYESVMPAQDYKDYDDALRLAGAEEPLAYFEHLLRGNEPILRLLDSDYTLANERLARFYGIGGVSGPAFRKVALAPEHHRGGVLTMAGLLTYLADGTRTLPVRRGAFILEQIFNAPPPPPPPNAGEIQPNTQGEKLTVRERLERHREEPTCASCHARIDPLGLALENYDAIGAWRDRQNGEGFSGPRAPEIDASGTLPEGTRFATPAEFKQVLLADPDRFARAFTQKLLTYALGRPVGYVDHALIEEIVGRTRADDYRLQTLVQAIVASEPFLTK